MGLMQRRRALMAGRDNVATVPLSEVPSGVAILIPENGSNVAYINLGAAYGNIILLRDALLPTMAMSSSGNADFATSTMSTWLNETFLERFANSVRRNLSPATISYQVNRSGTISDESGAFKAFIPSLYELGGTTDEGGKSFLNVLETYKNTTNANSARLAYLSGEGKNYWTRTAYPGSTQRYWIVQYTGAIGGTNYYSQTNSTKNAVRPALSFSPNTPVKVLSDGYMI